MHVNIKSENIKTFRTGVSGLEENPGDNSGALFSPTMKQNGYGGGVKEIDQTCLTTFSKDKSVVG